MAPRKITPATTQGDSENMGEEPTIREVLLAIQSVSDQTKRLSNVLMGPDGNDGIFKEVIQMTNDVHTLTSAGDRREAAIIELRTAVEQIKTRPCRYEAKIMDLEKRPTQEQMEKAIAEAVNSDHVVRQSQIRTVVGHPITWFLVLAIIILLYAHYGINIALP